MENFTILIAEYSDGTLKTVMVDSEMFTDFEESEFFTGVPVRIENYGEIEINGKNAHMLDSVMVSE